MADDKKETATIQGKLRLVQQGLKVDKTGNGRFGNYRTLDGMLEALKPLLREQELTLVIGNSIECIGGRNYVVAIAKVFDREGSDISAKAHAWEGEISRGLDAPQVTGAATTYARKYALAGLFAIDDGDGDPDSHKDPAPAASKPKIATGPEKFQLQKLMKEKGMDGKDEMTMFVESVINKKRVETHDDFVEVYHALTDGVDDQPQDDGSQEPSTA